MTKGGKGAMKDTNAPEQDGNDIALEDPLVEQFFPMAAKAIDTYGGVIRMNVLLADKEVAAIREQFPKNDPRYKMAKILGSEPRYFTLLDRSAFVATALGYKKGFVHKDGTEKLTEAGKKFLDKKREEERAGTRAQGRDEPSRDGRAQDAPKIRPVAAPEKRADKLNNGEYRRLFLDAANRFQKAMEGNDDQEFDEAIKSSRFLRREAKQNLGSNNSQVVIRPVPKAKAAVKRANECDTFNTEPPAKRGRMEDYPQRGGAYERKGGRQLEPQELEKKIEQLMRSTASLLEKRRDQEISLSELSTMSELRGTKGFMYDMKIPLSKIFSTCYPTLFNSYVTEKNQTIVQLIQPPEEGPLGTCPPEAIPEGREPRDRERAGMKA